MPPIAGKIEKGVAITDDELDIAFRFYGTLSAMLGALGPEFRLTHREALERFALMETFKSKRKRGLAAA